MCGLELMVQSRSVGELKENEKTKYVPQVSLDFLKTLLASNQKTRKSFSLQPHNHTVIVITSSLHLSNHLKSLIKVSLIFVFVHLSRSEAFVCLLDTTIL